VENNVTAPADKTPEQIQGEMAQTRESLTEKVSALEDQVVGTVQTAADTLTDTVQSVKSLITSAPGAVSDTVKQAADVVGEKMKQVFDISGHVRNHPWTSVGVSALAGCLTSWLIFRDTARAREAPVAPAISPQTYAPPAPSQPGVFGELFSMIGRKVREVAENVIDTASAAVNDSVRQKVPHLVDAAAGRLAPEASTATPTRGRGTEGSPW
jgi:ElaB/YqjD/DUF883 family membrane-anchored ribosome-binding protein/xanthosine utilization system XapX-like protein